MLEAMEGLSGNLIMAPSKTPSAEVAALRAALSWTMKNKSFKVDSSKAGEFDDRLAQWRCIEASVFGDSGHIKILLPALSSWRTLIATESQYDLTSSFRGALMLVRH